MISALLINLDESLDRLDFQKKQLEKLQIPFQRFSAVDISNFNLEEYENLANGWQRKLRKTEVACFLSHKNAWQYVLNSSKPWLILEDDAFLSKKCAGILTSLKSLNQQIDYLNLETRYRRKCITQKKIELIDDYEMRRLFQDRNGSAAYVLFPSGAEKLLKQAEKKAPALADAFISEAYQLNAWQIYPAAAIQFDQCQNYGLKPFFPMISTISPAGYSRPQPNCRIDYWRFKFRRIAGQIRMARRHFKVYQHARFVQVPIKTSDFEF